MKRLFSLFLVLFFASSLYADITPLPDPPQRTDPANFSAKADAFLGALPTFGTEANALAVETNGYKDAAAASATAADLSSESAEATANFKGVWSTLTGSLTFPSSVYHLSQYWQLTESIADVTAEVPGVSSKWISSQSGDLFLKFDSIADLRAITYTPEDGQVVDVLGYYAKTENKPWSFQWDSSDLSTEVVADTQSGIYVALDSDPTGATGAFVRQYNFKKPTFFGAVGDGVADDTAALQAFTASIVEGDTIIFDPQKRFLITGSQQVNILPDKVTVLGWGSELWSENSDDIESITGYYTPELRFHGNNCKLYGLSFRGGVFTVITDAKDFRAFGGRSYNSHNAGFQISNLIGMDYLLIDSWDFDVSLATNAGNYTSIQCGAVSTDPLNKLAIIQNCTFRGRAGNVNLHNFETVKVINMESEGSGVGYKCDEGNVNTYISGTMDGTAINGASANRHLSTTPAYAAFLASDQLLKVDLDLILTNFTGTAGVDYINTTSPIRTTGKLKAVDCSVPAFDQPPGYVDIYLDIQNCSGVAVEIASVSGTWALNQNYKGVLLNSQMRIGNSSINTQENKEIDVQMAIDYNGIDGAIIAVDTGAGSLSRINKIFVHNSIIKVGGGTGIIGVAGNTIFTLGRDNKYQGATTDYTGNLEGGYILDSPSGGLASTYDLDVGYRNTLAGNITYDIIDSRQEINSIYTIINDGTGYIALTSITLDGFSTTNQIGVGATLTMVKTGTSTWRTLSSYGTITQS